MKFSRNIGILIGVLCLCLYGMSAVAAPLTVQDKEQLKWLFGTMETAVNQADAQGLISLLSPNMPQERRTAITNEVYKRVAGGGVRLSFVPDLSDESIKELQPNILYEVSGTFSAEGPQWNVSGLSATFTVERVGYYFYIYDTNIFDKMSPATVFKIFKTVGVVFLVIGAIFLVGIAVLVVIIVLIVRSQKKKKSVVSTGDGPGTV